MRKLIENVVEDLLLFLDELDGDTEAEPSLGAPEPETRSWVAGGMDQRHWAASTTDEREGEDDDAEPSLGWTMTLNQASRNRLGGLDDREEEHDGAEPDVDAEPNGDELDGSLIPDECLHLQTPEEREDARAGRREGRRLLTGIWRAPVSTVTICGPDGVMHFGVPC